MKIKSMFTLLMFLLAQPNTNPSFEESYIIEIPEQVDLLEENEIEIRIVENNLQSDQTLEIIFPETFSLQDSANLQTISGNLVNNELSISSEQIDSQSVSIEIGTMSAGSWHGTVSFTISLETHYPSYMLVSGSELNDLLLDLDPVSITIQNTDTYPDDSYDVSLAQDGSVLLYETGENEVVITAKDDHVIYANRDMSSAFRNLSDLENICFSQSYDNSYTSDLHSMFENCENLTDVSSIENWDVSAITDMSKMFRSCESMTSLDLSNWNISSCQDISEMFMLDAVLTDLGDLDDWNLLNIIDASKIFSGCNSLVNIGDISAWDTSHIENMSSMFKDCYSLSDIGNISLWDVSSNKDFSYMFTNVINLSNYGDFNNWETDEAIYLNNMFEGFVSPSTMDLSNWNTQNVISTAQMFKNCSSLASLDIEGWDTSNVTDMSGMFSVDKTGVRSALSSVNGISDLDVHNLEDISYMFYKCIIFNDTQGFASWNTAKLKNISYAFYNDYYLDLSSFEDWDISSIENMNEAFGGRAGYRSSTSAPSWYQ